MKRTPLHQLIGLGQSVWLDDIRRKWLGDGTLAGLIERHGVSGLTSNPAIFKRSISQQTYERLLAALEHPRRVRCSGL